MKRALVLLMISAAGLSACGGKRIKIDYEPGQVAVTNDKKGAGVTAELIWVKNKTDSLDIMMTLKNGSAENLAFDPQSWTLTFNGQAGVMKYNDFKGGIVAAHGSRKELVVFSFEPKIPLDGDAVLTLGSFQAGKKTLSKITVKFPVRKK